MLGWFRKKVSTPISGLFGSGQTKVKQELFATVIRACPVCHAPGVDENGIEVGTICPSCFAPRPASENLGRIWTKEK